MKKSSLYIKKPLKQTKTQKKANQNLNHNLPN